MPAPKLPLTQEERRLLRKARIKTGEIPGLGPAELARVLQSGENRARELFAYADFQTIPSIGPRMAEMMMDLDLYSLEAVAHQQAEGAELLDRLEQAYGFWVDPCVEDSIRVIVYTAKTGQRDKRWFDFTSERKAYRSRAGYPADRPNQSWEDRRE